jgi:hypothetical protein
LGGVVTNLVSIFIKVMALVVIQHPSRCRQRHSTIRIQHQNGETPWI